MSSASQTYDRVEIANRHAFASLDGALHRTNCISHLAYVVTHRSQPDRVVRHDARFLTEVLTA